MSEVRNCPSDTYFQSSELFQLQILMNYSVICISGIEVTNTDIKLHKS